MQTYTPRTRAKQIACAAKLQQASVAMSLNLRSLAGMETTRAHKLEPQVVQPSWFEEDARTELARLHAEDQRVQDQLQAETGVVPDEAYVEDTDE